MSPLAWTLIIFEILFLVTFFYFSIIFFTHRHLLNKEYIIKEKYNEIIQFAVANKFRTLESLAKNNAKLEKVLENIKQKKQNFDDNIGVIYKKITALSMLNARYLQKRAKELTNEVMADLAKCEKQMDEFRFKAASVTEYNKNISDLIVEYRKIIDEVNIFYEFHLSIRYNNEIFKNMILTINQILTEISKFVIKINNDTLLSLLAQLNTHISNFYRLVSDLYVLDKVLMYLLSLQKELKVLLDSNAKILSSTDLGNIEKTYALAANNIISMQDNLKNILLKQARSNAIIAIKNLEKSLVVIKMGDSTNVLIQKDMAFLNGQINIMAKEIKQVQVAFSDIYRYFAKKDPFINDRISQLFVDLKDITYRYQGLKERFKDFDVIERKEFLRNINDTSIAILSWKDKMNQLVDGIKQKYKASIDINDELSDIKLSLNQLLGIKLDLNSSDQQSLETIKNIVLHVVEVQEKLSTDYFANYNAAREELVNIREQTALLIQSSSCDETLKMYNQRLIFFANKFRNEAEEINKNINEAEVFYKEMHYLESMNILMQLLDRVKMSAKIKKINF